jgi:hypothetical protein
MVDGSENVSGARSASGLRLCFDFDRYAALR